MLQPTTEKNFLDIPLTSSSEWNESPATYHVSLPLQCQCLLFFLSSAELTDLRDSLKEISEIVLNLRNLGQKLRAGLNEARDNLTAAKENCNNDPPSVQAGACDKIPSWDDLQAEADFNQVSNLCVKYPTILWSLTSAISFQTLGSKSLPQFQDFFSLSSCEGGL